MRPLIVLAALLALAPSAAALPDPTATALDATFCAAQEFFAETPQQHCGAVHTYTSQGSTYYVTPVGIYQESNGCEGLQTMADDCDGDGDVEPRDSMLTLGEALGGQGVPDA